ncbi:MAG TPA: apolipoprotein N-acyltransferase [Salinivirgaceae bacterium]|nr:apolipoprotein N-acyltransferase [Salinivirgaceae bacterium]
MKVLQKKWFLTLLSGLLLSLSWLGGYWAILMFIAFVPLLMVEQSLTQQSNYLRKTWLYSFCTFFIWNALTIWWLAFATFWGAVFAIVGNSFLMSFVFSLYAWSRLKTRFRFSPWILIIWWLAFEFAYLRTEISFPWLHLGNVFADLPQLIQWYEFTGVAGGSLLILIVNIFVFQSITKRSLIQARFQKVYQWVGFIAMISLFIWSCVTYSNYSDQGREVEVVVVQPNIDPYNEKFSGLTDRQQLERFLTLASTKISHKTELVIGPETALTEYIWENSMENSMSVSMLRHFLSKQPKLAVIVGASTRKIFHPDEEVPPTAIQFRDTLLYLDRYNTALLIDTTPNIQIHHKSKLVLGVETMPYPKYLKFLEYLSLDLGGTVGSLGTQPSPSVFVFNDIVAAPVICYESVYGDYVAEYVRKGANLITVITNDGWWDNTPGYKQHLMMSRLRAIENRRAIARSANTGISCFINQRGDVILPTSWWTPDAIVASVHLNKKETFYTYHGDYIGRIAGYFSLLLIIYCFSMGLIKEKSLER